MTNFPMRARLSRHIASALTKDLLDKWALSHCRIVRHRNGEMTITLDSRAEGIHLQNCMATDARDGVQAAIDAGEYDSHETDTGARPAGGDGPSGLRSLLSFGSY